MSDLEHRASKITGLIMSNGLADRFKNAVVNQSLT